MDEQREERVEADTIFAGLGNQTMQEFKPLAARMEGGRMRYFDKVLWLNNVILTVRPISTASVELGWSSC